MVGSVVEACRSSYHTPNTGIRYGLSKSKSKPSQLTNVLSHLLPQSNYPRLFSSQQYIIIVKTCAMQVASSDKGVGAMKGIYLATKTGKYVIQNKNYVFLERSL